jgi:hypothetical protein
MSLLKRIERAQPGQDSDLAPVPASTPSPTTTGGGPAAPGGEGPARPFAGGAPTRESFREAKYRVQNRLINELDPKMDLTNQVGSSARSRTCSAASPTRRAWP